MNQVDFETTFESFIMQVDQLPFASEKVEKKLKSKPLAIDGEDLTKDGGVLKTVLKKGTGLEKPVDGTEVSVHYVGKLLDGTVFDSSVERDECFKFVLGSESVIKGWEVVVKTMLLKEKCGVFLKPEYAYGKAGSPPKIPSDATLYFEIELLSFDNEKDISKKKDRGVMKRVLKNAPQSNYETPSFDTKCVVDIKVKDAKDEVLYEVKKKEVVVGLELYSEGVDIALESLKVGEKSEFKIKPEYCYGDAGCVEKKISPGIVTKWEIELLSMEKPVPNWKLEAEQKIEAAIDYKKKGNDYFAKGDYKIAVKFYENAIKYIEFMVNGDAKDENAKVKSIFSIIQFNMGQSYLKLKKYAESMKALKKGLEYDPKNVKALYRMAMVHDAFENYEEARECLKKVLECDSDNVEMKNALKCVESKISKQDRADKKLYASVFNRM